MRAAVKIAGWLLIPFISGHCPRFFLRVEDRGVGGGRLVLPIVYKWHLSKLLPFMESWGCGWASLKTRREQFPSVLPSPLDPPCLFRPACLGQSWLWSASQRIKWTLFIISSTLRSSNHMPSPPNPVPGIRLASVHWAWEAHRRWGRKWGGVIVALGKYEQKPWALIPIL